MMRALFALIFLFFVSTALAMAQEATAAAGLGEPTLIDWGTLLLAGLAAALSMLNLVKSGQQRIASYRRDWIENLRSHYAKMVSLAFHKDLKNEDLTKELLYEVEYFVALLNPDEHKELERAAYALAKVKDRQEAAVKIKEIRLLARAAFKAEWNVVKKETKLI